jgi:type VI secretion system secreted protein VgrG
MEIVTPLGEDVLLFHTMSAREEMSRLFEYQLDLLSARDDINLDEILGKNVTIKLALPSDDTRFYNGFVTRFAEGGTLGRFRRYSATVRPWLWLLTRTSDCRIFQDQTVPEIIKAVFADHGVADFKFELTSTYRKWTYCVQYRETDFNFVSRLMEHEGIGYHFRHTAGHNTLVLTDSTSLHTAVPGSETLSFVSNVDQIRPELEHIRSWEIAREIQPGVYVHDDYDLERPSVELKTSKALPRTFSLSDFEVFDYPGLYTQKSDGEQYAAVRMDELGSQFEFAQGKTNARGLTVGALLTLEDHPRADQNREYLIVSASTEMLFENYESLPDPRPTSYSCAFVAMSSSQQFRPRRRTRKPFVQGPQTAFVVGPAGEEIFTDELGRVKVQFHWDRRGGNDQHSSCFIRVSQYWAGKNWGAIHIPRIGHEVIVDFLEGDPDQPIVVGRVYNGTNLPPYKLPDNKTQSGVKSRSSLQGTPDNFNEIRFEDLKGKEEINIHAERNLSTSVEADESHSVGHDRSTTIGHDDVLTVKNDRKITVKDGNESHVVEKGQRTTKVNLLEKLDAKDIEHHATAHVHVIGDGYVSVSSGENGMQVYPGFVKVGTGKMANHTTWDGAGILMHGEGKVMIEGTSEVQLAVGGNTVTIKGGQIEIKADSQVNVAVGGNSVKVDGGGVTVTGSIIKLNC